MCSTFAAAVRMRRNRKGPHGRICSRGRIYFKDETESGALRIDWAVARWLLDDAVREIRECRGSYQIIGWRRRDCAGQRWQMGTSAPLGEPSHWRPRADGSSRNDRL